MSHYSGQYLVDIFVILTERMPLGHPVDVVYAAGTLTWLGWSLEKVSDVPIIVEHAGGEKTYLIETTRPGHRKATFLCCRKIA